MDDLNKNRIGLMRSIIVLTAIIISCTVFSINYKTSLKDKDASEGKEKFVEVLDIDSTNAIEGFESDFNLAKVNEIFRNSSLAFTDFDNLKNININKAEIIGFLNDTKLVLISGTYACVSNDDTCMYASEKTLDTFNIYVTFDLNGNNDYYMSTFNDLSIMNEEGFVNQSIILE